MFSKNSEEARLNGAIGARVCWGDPVERFWKCIKKGSPNECWEWQKALTRHPTHRYGRTHWGGRNDRSHRVVWKLIHGEIPVGLQVLHKCDNPPCCNPNHLFLGTPMDNHNDRRSKGRKRDQAGKKNNMWGKFGTDSPASRLTVEQVQEVRRLYKPGIFGYASVARVIGCSKTAIEKIVNGKSWPHDALKKIRPVR